MTVIKIWTGHTQFLCFSIYIPPIDHVSSQPNISIQPILDKIQSTIQCHTNTTDKQTTLLLAGDFNCHHPAWETKPVSPRLMLCAEELINFFQLLGLQWCLPCGQPTYWAFNAPGSTSTINLTVTDQMTKLIKCHLYHDNYGSDHWGTFSEWSLQPSNREPPRPKREYDRADWDKIGHIVQRAVHPWANPTTEAQLDRTVEELILTTQKAVEKHTPLARPCPYSK